MDFTFSEEENLFKKIADDFVKKEMPVEKIRIWDENKQFPYELWDKWAQLGWLGLPFPEEYGGSDAGVMKLAILGESLAKHGYDAAMGMVVSIYCGMNILHNGTKEQKEKYLPLLCEGKVRFSISMTEPNAGSDVASLKTKAELQGDHFLINGQKVFASGAHLKDNIIVMACRTDPTAERHKGISVILVNSDAPGVQIRPLDTLGRRIYSTNEVFLSDVIVPRENLLGELNGGWTVMTSQLDFERAVIATLYVGNAQSVVDEVLAYAKQREQFGRPIGKFQIVQHMIVDMQMAVDAARLLAYRAASMVEKGLPATKEVSMAKLYASETLAKVTNDAIQIMGGYGYSTEYEIARYFRDARITTVVGGSSQIQKNIIAKRMGL